jgi:enamine deaminase RidA (YjgF/YER057c/UK114 family)
MVVVSEQVPFDERGGLVGQGDPGAQVRQVFRNLSAAFAAAGPAIDQVVKPTVFLTDLDDWMPSGGAG